MTNPITPTILETALLTDTSANALVVGGAIGATTGTGGIKAGPIVSSSSVTDSVGTMATLRAGGIGIASQAALDLITAGSASQLARTAAGAALTSPRINAAGTGWEFANQPITLLKSESGTHTSASAANVSTLALASGLTALDTLLVEVSISVITANMAASILQNSTDSITIANLNGSSAFAFGITNRDIETHTIRRDPSSTTLVTSYGLGFGAGTLVAVNGAISTFTTVWTGAWTLALRLGAVTATGSCSWSWAVYRLSGQ